VNIRISAALHQQIQSGYLDVDSAALRRWLRRKGAKPASLLAMAKHFHGAELAVRHALEIVL